MTPVVILSAAISVTMFALGFGLLIPISGSVGGLADLVGVAAAMVVLAVCSSASSRGLGGPARSIPVGAHKTNTRDFDFRNDLARHLLDFRDPFRPAGKVGMQPLQSTLNGGVNCSLAHRRPPPHPGAYVRARCPSPEKDGSLPP
jgi:hypothetical protein